MRPLRRLDAARLHELWTAPGVRQFLWDGEIIPLERTLAAIETSARLFNEHRYGLWGVWRAEDSRLVGFGGFWHFRQPGELELLYGIAEEAWGRGYATEVGRALVAYGFNTLEMPAIRASTDAANLASVRVLEKLAFRLTHRAMVGGLDTVFYERQRGWPSQSEIRPR